MVEDLLKNNNLKVTKQRVCVLKSIIELEDNASIHNIVSSVDIDKSTVYRIINTLITNNVIEKDINYDNLDYYKLKSNHKHYIKCVKCKKISTLDSCPFDNVNVGDFEVINHSLKIEGICKDCKES